MALTKLTISFCGTGVTDHFFSHLPATLKKLFLTARIERDDDEDNFEDDEELNEELDEEYVAFINNSNLTVEGLMENSPAGMSLTTLSLGGNRMRYPVDEDALFERFPELDFLW